MIGVSAHEGRMGPIDGLRGFLALGVFCHHFTIWEGYLHTGLWRAPENHFNSQLGPIGVNLFFMITAFLFTRHIIGRELDWKALYIKRIFRIFPLYLLSVAIVFSFAFSLSATWTTSPAETLKAVGRWLMFQQSNINGIEHSSTLIAGVVWTLAYEAVFYCFLPILALLFRKQGPKWIYILPLLAFAYFKYFHMSAEPLTYFGSGILAAALYDLRATHRIAESAAGNILALICLATPMYLPLNSYLDLTMLSLSFILISSGASIFGMLTHKVSRTLGEATYSVYLLHGLLLTFSFRFLIGWEPASQMPTLNFALTALPITASLIVLSFLSYRFIEMPGIQMGKKLASWQSQRIKQS